MSVAPCELDAKLWRECLKEFSYGPDRPKGACDTERFRYYDCIKAWSKEQGATYDQKHFQVHDACAAEALSLHDCMKVSMFDIDRCLPQSLKLKVCSAKHDPLVRSALHENEEVMTALAKEQRSLRPSSRLEQLWGLVQGKNS